MNIMSYYEEMKKQTEILDQYDFLPVILEMNGKKMSDVYDHIASILDFSKIAKHSHI